MMKKLSLLLILSATTANAVECRPGYYLRGEVGTGMFTNDRTAKLLGHAAPLVGLAVGYKFKDTQTTEKFLFGTRVELNARYKKYSKTSTPGSPFPNGEVKSKGNVYSLLANGYWDIHTSNIFTPYLVVGMGAAKATVKASETEWSKTFVNFNFGLGSRIQLNKNIDVDLGYRIAGPRIYFKFTNNETTAAYMLSHEVALGLMYNF